MVSWESDFFLSFFQQFFQIGVIKGQMGDYQSVKDDVYVLGVRQERVVG